MPHKSLREILADLERRRSTDRFVDCLFVVQAPDGRELWREGGRWDRRMRGYVAGAVGVRETVRRVKWSQVPVAEWFAGWLTRADAKDLSNEIVAMLAGDRGSGKTHFVFGFIVPTIALKWPGDWQFGVNITAKQRRECIEAIDESVGDRWIAYQVEDLRDPYTEFITGSRIGWLTSKNPKALRQAKLKIRGVHINEGQDQPERIYFNAVGATRNVDGLTTVATNRPQEAAGDWVSIVATAIEAEEMKGALFLLDPKLNDAVSAEALDKRTQAIRVVSRQAADADGGGGGMKLSGPIAYPNFRPLPLVKNGHLGAPPPRPLLGQALWDNVTREITAEKMGGGDGFDAVLGADFQRRPGIVGIDCRFFRVRKVWDLLPLPPGTLVMFVAAVVNCPGDETAFSDQLEMAGYSPTGETIAGRKTIRAMIVGDGTGARQNAAHRWELPPSFRTLTNHGGWLVIPPHVSRKGRPINPRVPERRSHMFKGFAGRQILVDPSLKEPEGGFSSLIESLSRAKVTPRGGLVEAGGWQHAPDGMGYAWFAFGPRGEPPDPQGVDEKTYNQLAAVQVLKNG